jgi:hypothetical protein
MLLATLIVNATLIVTVPFGIEHSLQSGLQNLFHS